MPAHSTRNIPAATRNDQTYLAYLDYISAIKNDFDDVVVCLHEECIAKELWVREFEKMGLPIVQGASVCDRNALLRIRALMSQFEYVTSNSIGSHIPYAAAFGAKVSLAGPQHKFETAMRLGEPGYSRHPELIEARAKAMRSELKCFSFVATEPIDGELRIDWGMHQIGMENIVSPQEMIQLFRIGFMDECIRRAKRSFGRTVRIGGRIARGVQATRVSDNRKLHGDSE